MSMMMMIAVDRSSSDRVAINIYFRVCERRHVCPAMIQQTQGSPRRRLNVEIGLAVLLILNETESVVGTVLAI